MHKKKKQPWLVAPMPLLQHVRNAMHDSTSVEATPEPESMMHDSTSVEATPEPASMMHDSTSVEATPEPESMMHDSTSVDGHTARVNDACAFEYCGNPASRCSVCETRGHCLNMQIKLAAQSKLH